MEVNSSLYISGLLSVSWIAAALAQSGCYNYSEKYTAEPLHQKVFTSPNYPLHYDDNTDCSWMIQVNPSLSSEYIIKVTFEEFELEDDFLGLCMDDRLKFYDHSKSWESHLLGSYCSTVHPDVIYSTGPNLYINFNTDYENVYLGFKFYYTAVKKEEAIGICRSPYSVKSKLNGSSGTFFSPDYPVWYPKGATCIWQISVPKGKVVKLTFDDFALAAGKYDCFGDGLKDYVEIRDSLSSAGEELGLYNCRSYSAQLSVYSTGRNMFVKFYSSSERVYRSKHDRGFKASFEAVDPPIVSSKELCLPGNRHNNDLRLSGSTGSLKSPASYPTGLNCTWVISVPEGNIVRLSFSKFDMNYAGECGDHVEVFDGQYTSSKRLKKYCAHQDPLSKDLHSSGRYMTVRFKSEYRRLYFEAPNKREGFEAQFRASVKDTVNTTTVIGIVVGAVVFIFVVSLCVACSSKRKRASNRETRAARFPVATTTSHETHPPPPPPPPEATAVNPFPAPEVSYTAPPLSVYPYPLEPPPPYPGEEGAPQCPPPGESYPWLQRRAVAKPSAPPGSP